MNALEDIALVMVLAVLLIYWSTLLALTAHSIFCIITQYRINRIMRQKDREYNG